MYTKRNIPTMNHDLKIILNEIDRLASVIIPPLMKVFFLTEYVQINLIILLIHLKKIITTILCVLIPYLVTLQILLLSKNMIENMDAQSESIDSMKTAGNNLGCSIEHIFQLIESVQHNTNEMLLSSQTSSENMNSSIRLVNNSTEQITEINSAIQNFQDKIDKISDIIDMVKRIAQQSNLLAINASIEAAHAGEAGKGFAVVADEVRNLSQNTTDSASDIVSYVSQLKEDINVLAKSMNDTCLDLNKGLTWLVLPLMICRISIHSYQNLMIQ